MHSMHAQSAVSSPKWLRANHITFLVVFHLCSLLSPVIDRFRSTPLEVRFGFRLCSLLSPLIDRSRKETALKYSEDCPKVQ